MLRCHSVAHPPVGSEAIEPFWHGGVGRAICQFVRAIPTSTCIPGQGTQREPLVGPHCSVRLWPFMVYDPLMHAISLLLIPRLLQLLLKLLRAWKIPAKLLRQPQPGTEITTGPLPTVNECESGQGCFTRRFTTHFKSSTLSITAKMKDSRSCGHAQEGFPGTGRTPQSRDPLAGRERAGDERRPQPSGRIRETGREGPWGRGGRGRHCQGRCLSICRPDHAGFRVSQVPSPESDEQQEPYGRARHLDACPVAVVPRTFDPVQ